MVEITLNPIEKLHIDNPAIKGSKQDVTIDLNEITLNLTQKDAQMLAEKLFFEMFDESEQPDYLKAKIEELEKEIDSKRGYVNVA